MDIWQKHIRPQWTFWLWGLILIVPLISWLVWLCWPKVPIKLLIMDKTVLDDRVPEHLSLSWVLTHERYTNPNLQSYDPVTDYMGFKPTNRPKFNTDDLENFSMKELGALGNTFDGIYYIDTYGIYANEWFDKGSINEHSGLVYGGLTAKDAHLIVQHYQAKKLTLLEFNLLASPTEAGPRQKVEEALGFRFTGWTGRVFDNLDTTNNPDLPRWVFRMYKEQHQGRYGFAGPGFVIVHENGTIDILADQKDLVTLVPTIVSSPQMQTEYGVPATMPYPFWIDIVEPTSDTKVMARYELNPNSKGDSILRLHRIPKTFAAAMQLGGRSNAWYFCGDWSDNPIPYNNTYFAGVQHISFLFYPILDDTDRRRFFWKYYHPLIRQILANSFRKD
jgi:hypothetical protein